MDLNCVWLTHRPEGGVLLTTTVSTLTCSSVELAYLTALLGGEALVGVADPFHGWLAVEVEEALRQARSSLVARGVVTISPRGAVLPEPSAEQLLRPCLGPHASLRLTRAETGKPPLERYFHLVPDLAVEVAVEEGAVSLVPYSGWSSQLPRRLEQLLGLGSKAKPAGGPADLPSQYFQQAEALALESGAAVAAAWLTQVGVAGETAASLASAMAEPQGTCSVLRLARQGTGWAVEGVGGYLGAGSLWRMQPREQHGQTWLTLSPSTPEHLMAAIADLVGSTQ